MLLLVAIGPNLGVNLHAINASSPCRRPALFRADARRRAATRPPPLYAVEAAGAPRPRVRSTAWRRHGRVSRPLAHAVDASGRAKATSSLAPVAAPGAGRAARPRGGRRRPAAVAAATGRGPSAAAPVGGAPAAPAASRRRGRGAASPGGSGPRRARSPCGGAPVLLPSCLVCPARRVLHSRRSRRRRSSPPRDRPEGDPRATA